MGSGEIIPTAMPLLDRELDMDGMLGDAEARLPERTRAIYAERLRRHRRYTRTIVQNLTWNETPYFVSIETLALCNAACEFCPYPTLTRHGQKMPVELFYKIVNDLADKSPAEIPNFTLNRVSEPLLDPAPSSLAALIPRESMAVAM
jgi:sulfatase maturation enzyme AslB (radical SAM superfamily)